MAKQWVLILGGSSGLGLATAKKMASHGFHIIIIHRDRRSDLKEINDNFQEITSRGVKLLSFNIDATNAEKRNETIDAIKTALSTTGKIKMMVHSIAKGSLKPMVSDDGITLNHQDFEITLNAMALSLYDWTKAIFEADLFDEDTRIVAFTSEGSTKAWEGYAAVSAAKATLEALTRSIALEYAPKGIKANCIQAGTTETKAFAMIPNSETLKKSALERNPHNRLTTPEDVANAVYLLSRDEAKWITGTIIKVDGGESLQ
ncbi:SDR family oxidoreductase [Zobellia sp. 1_MG-2023]|uniref:SDR family oxidoreductase n=1 Tax=Zobellia sp. 1_MG-2023 TaxID=3062626 RepID=UPI0026E1BC27|nr:SDR family oxidoreductase [Zobellia sp. 1_MG-2023]MDO6820183.1 SDR family oxidoreductase [Zobellia sp. 1_MG-2023]